jgi:hypothetical protein
VVGRNTQHPLPEHRLLAALKDILQSVRPNAQRLIHARSLMVDHETSLHSARTGLASLVLRRSIREWPLVLRQSIREWPLATHQSIRV